MRPLIVALLSACSFQPSSILDGGGGDADGGVDAAGDANVCESWSPAFFDPCAFTPSPALTFVGLTTINTDTLVVSDSDGVVATLVALDTLSPPAALLLAKDIAIDASATVVVIGDAPLILASLQAISVEGLIDLGADFDTPRAGANPASCGPSLGGAGDDSGGGGGGGGGGGFQGRGGDGARGNTDGIPSDEGLGGVGAAAPPNPRGGCAGGLGGDGGGATVGASGSGGGALVLAARVSIALGVQGVVTAGGGGGLAPAGDDAGGSGGGSGGYIYFNTLVLDLADGAVIAANGGGGSSGARGAINQAGNPGSNGQRSGLPADGGSPAGAGGNGAGAAGGASMPDGDTAPGGSVNGGGGGGGAVGYILLDVEPTPGGFTISPPPQTLL